MIELPAREDASLQEEIDRLKAPDAHKEKYTDPTVQELVQALDIITRLRVESFGNNHNVPWNILRRAGNHLDQLLDDHLKQSN